MRLLKGLFACLFVFFTGLVSASSEYNISTTGRFDTNTSNSFVFTAKSCDSIRNVEYELAADDVRSTNLVGECQYAFSLPSELQPKVIIYFLDDSILNYQESYLPEKNTPEISLHSVEVLEIENSQALVVSYKAKDDTDVAKVSIDVKGITASSLRSVGGVIDSAVENAFVNSHGYQSTSRIQGP